MYPKIEAEPLKTHSQAEPGNERFSKLSRLMSMAESLYCRGIDTTPGPIIGFVDMLKDSLSLLVKKRLRINIR